MTFNHQKKERNALDTDQKLIIMIMIIMASILLIIMTMKLISEPIELEFSGRVEGDLQLDNVRVNYAEGHWKIKAPSYMFRKFIEGNNNYCNLNMM